MRLRYVFNASLFGQLKPRSSISKSHAPLNVLKGLLPIQILNDKRRPTAFQDTKRSLGWALIYLMHIVNLKLSSSFYLSI